MKRRGGKESQVEILDHRSLQDWSRDVKSSNSTRQTRRFLACRLGFQLRSDLPHTSPLGRSLGMSATHQTSLIRESVPGVSKQPRRLEISPSVAYHEG